MANKKQKNQVENVEQVNIVPEEQYDILRKKNIKDKIRKF